MDRDIIQKALGAIIIRGKKFLLERHGERSTYILPRGKLEEGETHKEVLMRELQEEFNVMTTPADFERNLTRMNRKQSIIPEAMCAWWRSWWSDGLEKSIRTMQSKKSSGLILKTSKTWK